MSGIVSKNAGRASGIVGTGDIGADAVDSANIADDAIDSEHYAAGSIDTAHIADNQITLAKMAGGTDGNIISYDASGDPVAIATGNDGQVLTSAGADAPPAFEDATASTPTDITVADESTDTTCFPMFVTAATGDLSPKSGTNLTFDSSNGILGATTLQTAGHIVFPGTQVASSNVNYLDDYEEGTFTPVLSDGTNNAGGYSTQVGHYIKIGQMVHCQLYVVTSSLGSVSGSLRITGFPFTQHATASNLAGCGAHRGQGLSFTAVDQYCSLLGTVNSDWMNVFIWSGTGGTGNMQETVWTADGGFAWSLTYQATA